MESEVVPARPAESGVIARELAARLLRIEAAMDALPEQIRAIRCKYLLAANSFRVLKAMIVLTPDTPSRARLLSAADIVLANLYTLAQTLTTLTNLQLAAQDYAVLVSLMRDDLEDTLIEADKTSEVKELVA